MVHTLQLVRLVNISIKIELDIQQTWNARQPARSVPATVEVKIVPAIKLRYARYI